MLNINFDQNHIERYMNGHEIKWGKKGIKYPETTISHSKLL